MEEGANSRHAYIHTRELHAEVRQVSGIMEYRFSHQILPRKHAKSCWSETVHTQHGPTAKYRLVWTFILESPT